MMNIITLKFDKTLIALSGNDFGYNTYINQIKEKLDMNQKNVIVFDNSIILIAISFVKGMFSDLIEKYTVKELKSKIDFQCFTKELENMIWEAVEF